MKIVCGLAERFAYSQARDTTGIVQAARLHDRTSRRAACPAKDAARWRRWTIGPIAVLCLIVGVSAWLYGATIYRFATNQGQLVVETDDPDVEVTVKQNGEQVTVIDRNFTRGTAARKRVKDRIADP